MFACDINDMHMHLELWKTYTHILYNQTQYSTTKKMQPLNIPISDATAGENDHHESNKKDDQECYQGHDGRL